MEAKEVGKITTRAIQAAADRAHTWNSGTAYLDITTMNFAPDLEACKVSGIEPFANARLTREAKAFSNRFRKLYRVANPGHNLNDDICSALPRRELAENIRRMIKVKQ